MRTPLTTLTTLLGLSFFDGFFGWGLPDGFYLFVGMATIAIIIWMWIIELR